VFIQAQGLALIVMIGLTLAVFYRFEFREKVPLLKEFQTFPLMIQQWHGQVSKLDPLIIDELDLSDYILVDYDDNKGKKINFYTAFYQSQRKGKSIHSPATCLPANGWIFMKTGTKEIQGLANSEMSIIANRAVLQMGERQQLSYYWFPCRGRNLTNMWQLKIFNFWDAIIRQRTDGALVRVITNIDTEEGPSAAEQRILQFIQNIVPILNEYLPK
jgi:EpsI family protein